MAFQYIFCLFLLIVIYYILEKDHSIYLIIEQIDLNNFRLQYLLFNQIFGIVFMKKK